MEHQAKALFLTSPNLANWTLYPTVTGGKYLIKERATLLPRRELLYKISPEISGPHLYRSLLVKYNRSVSLIAAM